MTLQYNDSKNDDHNENITQPTSPTMTSTKEWWCPNKKRTVWSNSAPDNIHTTVNYGSGSSKYGPIVKTASTEYGRF